MQAYDYKKEFKNLYAPAKTPALIDVPKMKFIMVEGSGNPNEEEGEYKKAVGVLYALSFTIKMSYKGDNSPQGYFSYVVPPLEGLWWMEGIKGVDYANKNQFQWISMIRQPEFVTEAYFEEVKREVALKKPDIDVSKAKFVEYTEGKCVQIMHLGPYDDEPATIKQMNDFLRENSLVDGFDTLSKEGILRRHHEIYLGDPRRCDPKRLKTIIRHPVM